MPRVTVTAYDPEWPLRFAAERDRIEAALRDSGFALHHIGSASVTGLAAKPVVDMLLESETLAIVDARGAARVALGYEASGAFVIEGRRDFRLTDAHSVRRFQRHAFERGSDRAARHHAFRDYLRTHRKVAEADAVLKLALAARHRDDMAAQGRVHPPSSAVGTRLVSCAARYPRPRKPSMSVSNEYSAICHHGSCSLR